MNAEMMHYIDTPPMNFWCGGTGGAAILHPYAGNSRIRVFGCVSDDGGAAGEQVKFYEETEGRKSLAVSDLRQNLAALATNRVRAKWFNERPSGQHPHGSVYLKEREIAHGIDAAIRDASHDKELGVKAEVYPVTRVPHVLKAVDGTTEVCGETNIEHTSFSKNVRLSLVPAAPLHEAALIAMKEAAANILGPGTHLGSQIPVILVDGLREAWQESRGRGVPAVLVMNLCNKAGHTDGWDVVEYVQSVESYLGEGAISHVLYNTAAFSDNHAQSCAWPGEEPVRVNEGRFSEVDTRFIGAHLLDQAVREPNIHDPVVRSRVVHDGFAVAALTTQIALGQL